MTSLNRRELLGVFAGVSATQLVPTRVSAASLTHYGFKLGEFDLTIFSDGHLAIPTRALARNASEADIKALIQQSADMVTPECNVTLVRTPIRPHLDRCRRRSAFHANGWQARGQYASGRSGSEDCNQSRAHPRPS